MVDLLLESRLFYLFMFISFLSCIYFMGIRPWHRRWKNKVSLSKQVKLASITLFAYFGIGVISNAIYAIYFRPQRELSLMNIIGIAILADQAATAILIIRRSMHALISLLGAMALFLFFNAYVWFFIDSYPDVSAFILGLIIFACLCSPVIRGIFAIRDLKRIEK